MQLVYNPYPTPVAYDDGKYVDPDSWAFVDVKREDIRLVQVEIPESIPEGTNPRAIPALEAAIRDREETLESAKNETLESAKNDQQDEVRNTDSTNKRNSRRSNQNKEA